MTRTGYASNVRRRAERWAVPLAAFICISVALGGGFSVFAQSGQQVTVEGVGTIISGDTARARDEAIRDAYRRAAEAVGVYIDARTEMENFQIMFDKVTSATSGYVKSYQIIGEGPSPDGLYRVRITAIVVQGNIKQNNDMDALAMLIDMMGNPVIMVMIQERNLDRPQQSSQVESEIIKQMTRVRYHLVDPKRIEAIKQSEMAKAAMAGDINAAMALGEREAADLVVAGSASSSFLTSTRSGNFTFNSCKAYSDVRVVTTRTGQIIMAENPEQTQADLSVEAAGVKALKALGSQLAQALIWGIPKCAGGGDEGSTLTIQVIVRNCSFSQRTQIVNALKSMRGVSNAYPRSFEGGVAVFDVVTTGNSEELAARLDGITSPKLEILTLSREKIECGVQ